MNVDLIKIRIISFFVLNAARMRQLKRRQMLILSLMAMFVMAIVTCKLCLNTSHTLSPHISKAISLFYVENQNYRLLSELDKVDLKKTDRYNQTMYRIFRAAALCEMKRVDSAYQSINRIGVSDIGSDRELQFWYGSIKGLVLFRMEEYSAAYKELAQTVHSTFDDERALALNKRILGRLCFESEDIRQAFGWIKQSSDHFIHAGLPKGVAVNEKIIGQYYIKVGNLKEAFAHFSKAEAGFRATGDQEELFYLYVHFIDYYLAVNNFNKALSCASKAYQYGLQQHDNRLIALVLNNYGEIEIQRHRFREAVEYLQKALSFYPAQRGRIIASLDLSQAHVGLSQLGEALKYARQAVGFVEHSGQVQLQMQAYETLAHIYKTMNMEKLAYCYLDSAMQIKDSSVAYTANINRAYQETKAGLDSMSLNVQVLKQRHKRQLVIDLSTIIVLLIVVAFVLITYRLIKQKNTALVKKNMEMLEERKHYSSILQHNISIKKRSKNETDNEKLGLLYSKLIQWLETEKRFTQSDISLDVAAKELETNRDYLSKAINERFGRFTDLVNKYRIEEAIDLLSDTEKQSFRYKLSIIASQVGFNSSSAFIEAFKKQTQLTPAQFRKNLSSLK